MSDNKNNFKNLKPDSAKAGSSIKTNFKRKNSQEKTVESSFLYYISSIIKGYMQPEITRPIELIREHLL